MSSRILGVFLYELQVKVTDFVKRRYVQFRQAFPATTQAYCTRFGHSPGPTESSRQRLGGPYNMHIETVRCLRCHTVVREKEWEV